MIGFAAWGLWVASVLLSRTRRGRIFKWNSGLHDLEALAAPPGQRKAGKAMAAVEAEQAPTADGAAGVPRDEP